MDHRQLNLLDKHLLQLSKSFDIDDVLLRLTVRSVFDTKDRELVKNDALCRNSSEKRMKIVDLLRTRDSDSYWHFCHALKNKTPHLFNLLHVLAEGDTCPQCTNEPETCTYCKGLVEVLQDLEKGIFLEKPEGIVDLFIKLKKQLSSKNEENDHLAKEIAKLRQDYSVLIAQNARNEENIKLKESTLAHKEEQYKTILKHNEDKAVENEQLTLKLEKQTNIAKEQLKEMEQLREQVNIYESDPIYQNSDAVDKEQIKNLRLSLERAKQEIAEKDRLSSHYRLEASRLRIHTESLEEVLTRQRDENNRVFTDLTDSHEMMRCRVNDLEEDIEQRENLMKTLKVQKEEISNEKNHLFDTVREKHQKLITTQFELETSERNLKTTKSKNERLMEKQSKLEVQNEHLTQQYETKLAEYRDLNERHNTLQRNRDELVQQLISSKDSKVNVDPAPFEKELQELRYELSEVKQRLAQHTELQPNDTQITLRRLSASSRFGVHFSWKKGPVLLGESKVIVCSIEVGNVGAPLGEIRVGDFVISINDKNVQNYGMSDVRQICPADASEMKLVLRRPTPRSSESQEIKCRFTTACHSWEDLGFDLKLHICFKNDHTRALTTGLQEMDELVQIKDDDSIPKYVQKIKAKIVHSVKQQKLKDHQTTFLINRCNWNKSFYQPRVSRSESSYSLQSSNSLFSLNYSDLTETSPLNTRPSQHANRLSTSSEESRLTDINGRTAQENHDPDSVSLTSSSISSDCEKPTTSEIAPPLPRRQSAQQLSDQQQSDQQLPSKHFVLEYTRNEGVYSYVDTHEFDKTRKRISQAQSFDDTHEVDKMRRRTSQAQSFDAGPHNDLEYVSHDDEDDLPISTKGQFKIEIIKESFENFGINIIGGNKSGIFVNTVENWKPACNHNVKRGMRIIKIEGYSLKNVAHCYAVDVLQKHTEKSKVTFVFQETPLDKFEEILKKTPYDSFHVKTLKPYQARHAGELSFSAGEILCVINSCVITQPGKPYKWQAIKDELTGTYQIKGLIPRQISSRSPTAIADHFYEEIDKSPSMDHIPDRNIDSFYQIMEPVGEVLV